MSDYGVSIRRVEVAQTVQYMTTCDCGARLKPHPRTEDVAYEWATDHMREVHGCAEPKVAVPSLVVGGEQR